MTAAFDAELEEHKADREKLAWCVAGLEDGPYRWKLLSQLEALDRHITRYVAIASIPTTGEAA